MTVAVPQLLTPRQASIRTRLPWCDLRTALEKAGFRVVRIGNRERVAEADLAALLEDARQPTAAESAARTDLALAQTLEEMGIRRRARRTSR